MTIGIIGAGAIGSALAEHFAGIGEPVLLANSRGPQTITVPDQRVTAVDAAEAAAADVVVLAVPWDRLQAAVAGTRTSDWTGTIVVDATNAIVGPDFRPGDLGGYATSTEAVQALVPGAHVVKAFGTLLADVLAASPVTKEGRRVVFLSGDHAAANAAVADLADRVGWAPVDLGPLSLGGPLLRFPGGPLPALDLVLQA